MIPNKCKRKDLRQLAAAKGIFSIAELARRVGCSRTVIYLALENPNRYSRVQKSIVDLIGTSK